MKRRGKLLHEKRMSRIEVQDVFISLIFGCVISLVLAYSAYSKDLQSFERLTPVSVEILDYRLQRTSGGRGGNFNLELRHAHLGAKCLRDCEFTLIHSISPDDRRLIDKLFRGKVISIWIDPADPDRRKFPAPKEPRFYMTFLLMLAFVGMLAFLISITFLTVARAKHSKSA